MSNSRPAAQCCGGINRTMQSVGTIILLVLFSTCFLMARRRRRLINIGAEPDLFGRDGPPSSLPFWPQGTQVTQPPAYYRQPHNAAGNNLNQQSAAPPPYMKEGATAPLDSNYTPVRRNFTRQCFMLISLPIASRPTASCTYGE